MHGRGVSSPHPRPERREKIGITISMDYCFMNGAEDDDPSLPGILMMWDDNHECLWELPVERKGLADWIVKWIVDKLDEVGYRGEAITVKSDQEPSMLGTENSSGGQEDWSHYDHRFACAGLTEQCGS